jgi:glycosyltransferase involved in cell wall biosynthesis
LAALIMSGSPDPSTPVVAIITPVYNGALYLAETMDCVQAQTYPNLVHVVLDNASTDATPEILARYANARVPVVVTRNPQTLPLSENWQRALTLTPPDARWVRVLCADDKMTPDCIAKTAGIGNANPNVAVIGCGFQVMDTPQSSNWPPGITVLPGREAVRRYFMGEGEIIGPHLMWRADVMRKRQPFYDLTFHGIDTEAAFFMLQHGDWGVTTEILAWTRIHEATESHNVMHVRGTHFLDWLRYIERYGRWAMNSDQFAAHRRAFRRYYLRRLLRWRLTAGGQAKFEHSVRTLRELGMNPTPLDFLDANADYVLKRLGVRAPVRAGFPLG